MVAGRIVRIGLVLGVFATFPPSAHAAEKDTSGWWQRSFLVDYGLIAAGGAGYFLRNMEPTSTALIGVQYDPGAPWDVLDSKYSDRIGRSHLQEGDGETVSTAAATVVVAAGFGYLAAEQGARLLWGQGSLADRQLHMHETLVGYLETVALSSGLNSVLKNYAGRLRPDFQDRARRWHCSRKEFTAQHCPVGVQPLHEDPEEAQKIWWDGRRSFMSGHSVSAMNFATYLSLSIGGQWVWGEGATGTSRAVGLAAQTLLLTSGMFIATSRFDDGRHHLGDVLTGSVFGLAVANFSYWRRFGIDGRPRRGKARQDKTSEKPEKSAKKRQSGVQDVQLSAGPGLAGLALSGRF